MAVLVGVVTVCVYIMLMIYFKTPVHLSHRKMAVERSYKKSIQVDTARIDSRIDSETTENTAFGDHEENVLSVTTGSHHMAQATTHKRASIGLIASLYGPFTNL